MAGKMQVIACEQRSLGKRDRGLRLSSPKFSLEVKLIISVSAIVFLLNRKKGNFH